MKEIKEIKEIKNYLHLYLGCECYDHFNDVTINLTPLAYAGWDKREDEQIKLILRSLSDMTELEAIELAKLSEMDEHFNEVRWERNTYNDIIVSWQGANEDREVFNATGERFYCAEQFTWLLSKHFDLFGLIEAGLAIDEED